MDVGKGQQVLSTLVSRMKAPEAEKVTNALRDGHIATDEAAERPALRSALDWAKDRLEGKDSSGWMAQHEYLDEAFQPALEFADELRLVPSEDLQAQHGDYLQVLSIGGDKAVAELTMGDLRGAQATFRGLERLIFERFISASPENNQTYQRFTQDVEANRDRPTPFKESPAFMERRREAAMSAIKLDPSTLSETERAFAGVILPQSAAGEASATEISLEQWQQAVLRFDDSFRSSHQEVRQATLSSKRSETVDAALAAMVEGHIKNAQATQGAFADIKRALIG